MLQPTVVHDQHDQVDAFDADLQAPASTTNGNECGSAPAFGGAAGSDATSVLAAKDEAAFEQVWHYDDAFCTVQHVLGDTVGGRGPDRWQDFHGFLHAVDGVCAVGAGESISSGHAQQAHQHE